jgi:Icc-related predicted phosphoesterase
MAKKRAKLVKQLEDRVVELKGETLKVFFFMGCLDTKETKKVRKSLYVTVEI